MYRNLSSVWVEYKSSCLYWKINFSITATDLGPCLRAWWVIELQNDKAMRNLVEKMVPLIRHQRKENIFDALKRSFSCETLTRAQMWREVKTHFFIVTLYLAFLTPNLPYVFQSYFCNVASVMFQIQFCVWKLFNENSNAVKINRNITRLFFHMLCFCLPAIKVPSAM